MHVPTVLGLTKLVGLSMSGVLSSRNGCLNAACNLQDHLFPISAFKLSGDPSGFAVEITVWPDGLSGGRCFTANAASDDPARAWLLAILSALISGDQS